MVLIGCQPVELDDYGGGLRPLVGGTASPKLWQIARQLSLLEWNVATGRTGAHARKPAFGRCRRSAAMPMRRAARRRTCGLPHPATTAFFPGALLMQQAPTRPTTGQTDPQPLPVKGGHLMCVGIPMRLTAIDGIVGHATDNNKAQLLDLSLLRRGTGRRLDPVPFSTHARSRNSDPRSRHTLILRGAARSVVPSWPAAMTPVMPLPISTPARPRLPPHLQAALDAGQNHRVISMHDHAPLDLTLPD